MEPAPQEPGAKLSQKKKNKLLAAVGSGFALLALGGMLIWGSPGSDSQQTIASQGVGKSDINKELLAQHVGIGTAKLTERDVVPPSKRDPKIAVSLQQMLEKEKKQRLTPQKSPQKTNPTKKIQAQKEPEATVVGFRIFDDMAEDGDIVVITHELSGMSWTIHMTNAGTWIQVPIIKGMPNRVKIFAQHEASPPCTLALQTSTGLSYSKPLHQGQFETFWLEIN